MNKLIDPFQAQAQYPDAWQLIENEMQQARDGYAATLVPVAAEVVTLDGAQVLQVAALTDLIAEGEEGYPATMSFTARLASPA
ncbi:hypothetical protein ACPPVV_09455 [Rhodanobacter sp. Col0626]|uniref:hypothetical protein n=1 Tax=Rhodanobacter sp. Col0626 TaxID=3415679 RepID=UPI003CEA216C